jgi:hypothetical protein
MYRFRREARQRFRVWTRIHRTCLRRQRTRNRRRSSIFDHDLEPARRDRHPERLVADRGGAGTVDDHRIPVQPHPRDVRERRRERHCRRARARGPNASGRQHDRHLQRRSGAGHRPLRNRPVESESPRFTRHSRRRKGSDYQRRDERLRCDRSESERRFERRADDCMGRDQLRHWRVHWR